MYRIINFFIFKSNFKKSLKIYKGDKKTIFNKISSDVNIIFREKATRIFSPFGTGKTFYIQNLVHKYLSYKYGTWIFYFNVWWVKTKNTFSNNILDSKVSFGGGASGKNLGVSFSYNGQSSSLLYCFAFIISIFNLFLSFLILVLAYFWTFGWLKFRKIIVIDDPDREKENKWLSSFANKKYFFGDVYVILHSYDMPFMDKFINARVTLPSNRFTNLNIRIYNQIFKKTNEEELFKHLKKYDLTNHLKEQMFTNWLLFKTICKQSLVHEKLLSSLLLEKGKDINEFLISKRENNNFNFSLSALNNNNEFISKYCLQSIFATLKDDLLLGEKNTIDLFVETWNIKMINCSFYKEERSNSFDFEKFIKWSFEEIVEFKKVSIPTWVGDLDSYSKIEEMIKSFDEIKNDNPLFDDLNFMIKSYIFLKQNSEVHPNLKKILPLVKETKIKKNIEKAFNNFRNINGSYFSKYVFKKILKWCGNEELIVKNLNIKEYKENYLHYDTITNFEIAAFPFFSNIELKKLSNDINNLTFSEQYKFVKYLTRYLNRISSLDEKSKENFIEMMKNIKFKKVKDYSPQNLFYKKIVLLKKKVMQFSEIEKFHLNQIYSDIFGDGFKNI